MKYRLFLLILILTQTFAHSAEEARYAGKPLAFWLDELKSDDPLIREEAVVVLTEAGPAARAAVPRLQVLAKDEHRRLRLRAALALWHIDGQKKPAIDALSEAVRDPTTSDRLELLRTLTNFGPDAVSSASAVLEAANDADPILATQAVQMLAKLGPGIVGVLTAELEHKDVRRRRIGAPAVPALLPLLRHAESRIRLVGCRVISAMGPAAKEAVPKLAELLQGQRCECSSPSRYRSG